MKSLPVLPKKPQSLQRRALRAASIRSQRAGSAYRPRAFGCSVSMGTQASWNNAIRAARKPLLNHAVVQSPGIFTGNFISTVHAMEPRFRRFASWWATAATNSHANGCWRHPHWDLFHIAGEFCCQGTYRRRGRRLFVVTARLRYTCRNTIVRERIWKSNIN